MGDFKVNLFSDLLWVSMGDFSGDCIGDLNEEGDCSILTERTFGWKMNDLAAFLGLMPAPGLNFGVTRVLWSAATNSLADAMLILYGTSMTTASESVEMNEVRCLPSSHMLLSKSTFCGPPSL